MCANLNAGNVNFGGPQAPSFETGKTKASPRSKSPGVLSNQESPKLQRGAELGGKAKKSKANKSG